MKAFIPEITSIKQRNVLTVVTLGDPNKVTEKYMKALFGTAYNTKMKFFKPKGVKMDIGPLSAFWPDAHLKKREEWTGIWNLEVPSYVRQTDLLQKDASIKIKLEKLKSGKVAQVLHIGPFSEEGATVKKLHNYIQNMGLEIIGDHEEVYLTKPGSKNQKTTIRYLVK
jgi:hypothetical protein